MIKNFPIWCNVTFESVFTALNNTKKQRKFNIMPYEENLLVNLLRLNLKSGGLHLWKGFYSKKIWDGLPVFRK